MSSDYCKNNSDQNGIKVSHVKKLIPNLSGKINYIVHYRNLQFYSSLGMELTKTHRFLKFRQSDLIKYYISFNTKKEQKLLITLKTNFLMINSAYGKTMENLRKIIRKI